ncbi:MAG TPA: hypothetical protein VNV88_14225 [Candidatus Solibacter sp.]|jgi:hypothetical protein|nr:hypothetical protein [Candidatus Solibacter sp.]
MDHNRRQRPGVWLCAHCLWELDFRCFSTIGGLLFALTYQQSGSLLLACIEHAIFGNFIFTIGLGQFFYHGARLKTG